jgi:hypothetical protein
MNQKEIVVIAIIKLIRNNKIDIIFMAVIV